MDSAQQIRDLISRVGSQKEFAAHFGVPLSTVEKWAQGVNAPPAYVLDLIDFRLTAEEKSEEE